MNDRQDSQRNRLKGIALICVTFAMFACLDATAKYLSQFMDPMQVTWARYTAGFVLAIMLSNPVSHPGLMRTTRPWMQMLRSLLLLGCTLFNFLAVKYLQPSFRFASVHNHLLGAQELQPNLRFLDL